MSDDLRPRALPLRGGPAEPGASLRSKLASAPAAAAPAAAAAAALDAQPPASEPAVQLSETASKLCAAATSGDVGAVRELLTRPDADVNCCAGDGRPLLLVAAQSGSHAVVDALLATCKINPASADAVNSAHSIDPDIRWRCGFLATLLTTASSISEVRFAELTNTYLRRRHELLSFVPLDRALETLCESLCLRETVLTDAPGEMLEDVAVSSEDTAHSVAALEALGVHSRRINDLQAAIAAAASKGGLDGHAAVEKLAQERASAAAATAEGLAAVVASLQQVDRQYAHALGLLAAQEKKLDALQATTRRDESIGAGIYQSGPEPPLPPSPPPTPPPSPPPMPKVRTPTPPSPSQFEGKVEVSSSEEEAEPQPTGLSRRSSIFGGSKFDKEKKRKKKEKEKKRKRKLAEAAAAAAEAAAKAAEEAHAQAIADAKAEHARLIAAAQDEYAAKLAKKAAARAAVLEAKAAEAAKEAELARQRAEYEAGPPQGSDGRLTGLHLGKMLAEWEAQVESYRAVEAAHSADVDAQLVQVRETVLQREEANRRLASEMLHLSTVNASPPQDDVPPVVEVALPPHLGTPAPPASDPTATPAPPSVPPPPDARDAQAGISPSAPPPPPPPPPLPGSPPPPASTPPPPVAAAAAGGEAAPATAAAPAAAPGSLGAPPVAADTNRDAHHGDMMAVAERLDALARRLFEQRFKMALQLLRSERELSRAADKCFHQRSVVLANARRHLRRVQDHCEYQRLQLAELLEEHSHLQFVVSDLLPGSAWAGVAAHLRTKIADFDRRIVALLDQRDAAHLEVRKAERRGLKDAAAEAQAEMSRLSRSIVELEKTRQLGLARLNELAGSLFPELALLDGVTLAEGSGGAAIVERSFDDYENVGNYFSGARDLDSSSDDSDDSDDSEDSAASVQSDMLAMGGHSHGTSSKSKDEATTTPQFPMFKATTNGRKVVLKAFAVNRSVPASALQRQLSIFSRLRHPNVMRPRALVRREQAPDVATMLELPAWRYDLGRWLRRETPSLRQKQGIARQVLAGLAYLHDHNIVHCDVQPGNVLMTRDGVPMLSEYDIGLAEAVSAASGSRAAGGSPRPSSGAGVDPKDIKGTPGYRAPEVQGGYSPSAASDVYSLGVLLHWLHTERSPTRSSPLTPTGVPELDQLLPQLLAANPHERPSSVSCLAAPYFADSLDGESNSEDEGEDAARTADAPANDTGAGAGAGAGAGSGSGDGSGDGATTKGPRLTYRASRRRLNAFRRELHTLRSYARYALANAPPGTEDDHWITVTCHKGDVVRQVMHTFATSGMRANIRVRFTGMGGSSHVDVDGDGLVDVTADGAHADGVGDGWLLNEMFAQFFAGVVHPRAHLFETCLTRRGAAAAVAAHGVAKADAKAKWRLSGTAGAEAVYLPAAGVQSEAELAHLHTFGRVLAGALLCGRRIGCHVAPALWKYISGERVNVHDLRPFDPTLARTLRWLLAVPGAGKGLMGLTFEGVKEGGRNIPLTDGNKEEFVELLTRQVLFGSREAALQAVKAGFLGGVRELSPASADSLETLSATDLMLLLHGGEAVSSELVESCTYALGFPLGNPVPRWFRQALRKLSPDDLRRFLIAVIHSPSLPRDTFGMAQIHVVMSNRTSGYLVSFGGFGHLSVPAYESREELEAELAKFVRATC